MVDINPLASFACVLVAGDRIGECFEENRVSCCNRTRTWHVGSEEKVHHDRYQDLRWARLCVCHPGKEPNGIRHGD